MSNISRYRQYLVLDYIAEKFEELGFPEPGNIHAGAARSSVSFYRPGDGEVQHFASVLSGEVSADEIRRQPYLYVHCNSDVQITFSGGASDWMDQDRQDELQAQTESRLFALLKVLPGAIVLRIDGEAYIAGQVGLGGTYLIQFGRALCERVVVGTRKVRKPVNPEAARKIMEAIEHVEVDEPVTEWRCNDAELTAGVL